MASGPTASRGEYRPCKKEWRGAAVIAAHEGSQPYAMTKPDGEAQPCLPRCRCFVKQQDQAVKVHDPVLLAEYFEALIGTSGYVQSIAETRQDISDKVKTSETVHASVSRQARSSSQFVCELLTPQNDNAFAVNVFSDIRIEGRRAELSPGVQKCKAYMHQQRSFLKQKHSFLRQQQRHLHAGISALHDQVQSLQCHTCAPVYRTLRQLQVSAGYNE